MQALVLPLAVLALGPYLAGQAVPSPSHNKATSRPAPLRVSYMDERIRNPTRKGSRGIVVYYAYPSRHGGVAEPPIRRRGGYPVIVMLHGAGCRASAVRPLAVRFVRRGYVVVATDRGGLDPGLQANNALALIPALRRVNADKTHELFGLFDLERAGICGHSMGGGNTIRVLASQGKKGFRAGFCFAPWDGHTLPGTGSPYIERYARKVKVPLGIAHGAGDLTLPMRRCALGFFNAMKNETPASKLLYVLSAECDHHNVAMPSSNRKRREVFEFCADLSIAFFDKQLRGRTERLEELLERRPPWRLRVLRDSGKRR